MDFEFLLNDKSIKAKEKTEMISSWILKNPLKIDHLIDFAVTAKPTIKATCIEVFEYVTKTNSGIADSRLLNFVSESLKEKEPRVKWESARVIGNIAALFPSELDLAIINLLENSKHTGTVVRWSTAYALGEILQIPEVRNNDLVGAIENICDLEEKNSIKKIYLTALKKIKHK